MGVAYLDSGLLIYAIEPDPEFGARTIAALAGAAPARLAISPMAKLECPGQADA